MALGGSALLCVIVWLMRSRSLGRPLDIVAWVTYADYNFPSAILRYRLEADAFPVLAILIYLVISRWGPLRARRVGDRVSEERVAPDAVEAGSPKPLAIWAPSRSLAATLARTLPPALFLGWCARPGFGGLPISRALLWFLLSVGYIGVVCGGGWLLARHDRRRNWPLVDWVSAANAFACPVAAFAGLWWLSHTAAVRLVDGSIRHWRWVPIWFAALAVVAVWGWSGRQLKRGRSPLWLESRVRVAVLGAVAMYILTAALAQPPQFFQGFDDAQLMTFARLLQDGYFPWRDFVMAHGPLDDLLQPLVGFSLFQNSVWGANAGTAAVVLPLCWVCVYWLGVWVARPGSPFVLAPLVWAASGLGPLDPRFLFVPLTLILLGCALARPTRFRLAALTTALFLNALATPESGFVVIGSVIALIAADLAAPAASRRLLAQLPRTTTFAVTGAVLTAAWAVFLAAEGALHGFIQYFQFFLSQHTAQSFIVPAISSLQSWMFAAMKLFAVAVILAVAWRVRHRLRLTPVAGVAFASAIAAALYGEQAVGRMDTQHTAYSLQMALPLFMICVWWILARLDSLVDLRAVVRLRPNLHMPFSIRNSMTILAVAIFALATSAVASSFEAAPSRTLFAGHRPTIVGPIGYMKSGAIPSHELTDWRKIVSTYATPQAPFLDMTNSTGYFYYLLRLKPASMFTSLGTALNPAADTILRNNVKASQPPLVTYSSDFTGLTSWDGVADNVRNYLTSQYVLSHWTPILKSHGMLFLIRNNLLRKHPTVPHLSEPPITTNLYNSVPSCGWGDAPNFLQSTPVGPSVTVSARVTKMRWIVTVTGWAFDGAAGKPPREVVILAGSKVEAVVPTNIAEPSIATKLQTQAATYSGFSATYTTVAGGPVSAYAFTADGALHLLPGATAGAPTLTSIKLPRRPALRVGAPGEGSLQYPTWAPVRVTAFKLPSGAASRFPLATFHAGGKIGTSQLTLSDTPGGTTNATITATALPITGADLPIRVGSCLQWRGYHARTLYLTQQGGVPITSLRLSGVRQ